MTIFLTVATSVISSGALTAFMTKRLEAKIRHEERIEQAMSTILSDLDDWRMATSASATEIYNVAIDRENDDGVKPRLTKETTDLVVKRRMPSKTLSDFIFLSFSALCMNGFVRHRLT